MEGMAEAMEGDDTALSDMTERLGALEGMVSGASDEIAALGQMLSDNFGQVMTVCEQLRSDLDRRISSLEERIGEVAADLGSRMSETATEQTEALRAALQSQPAPAQSPTAENEAPSDPEQAPRAALPEGLHMAGEARGVGETFVLAGGAVRAFVQRADAGSGRAQLSVNRVATDLAVGETMVVPHATGACRLVVAAVTGDGVAIGSDCDVPAGDGTLGAAFVPGNVAMLADGKLRVFVSGIFGDEVRLAMNGLETQRVRVGEAHEVDVDDARCSVSVTGVRDNSVMLAGTCP